MIMAKKRGFSVKCKILSFKNKILVLALAFSSNLVFVTNVFSGKDGDEALQELYQTHCSYEGMLKTKDGGKVSDRWTEEFKMLTEPHDHPNFIAINNKLATFSIFPHRVIEDCPKLKAYLSALANYSTENKNLSKDLRYAIEFIYRIRVKGEIYRQLESNSSNTNSMEGQKLIKEISKQQEMDYLWVPCNEGLVDKRVAALYVQDGVLYAKTDNGVLKSENNGDNWITLNGDLPQNSQIANTIFTSGNKLYVGTNTGEIFERVNSKEKWKRIDLILPKESVDVICKVNDTWYAGHIHGLLKSNNYGKNWVDISGELTGYDAWLESYKMVVTIYSFKEILYIGTRSGIFTSIDGEHMSNHKLRYDSINAIVSIGDTIYIGSDGGVFKSVDLGENWVAVNHGLTTTNIDVLRVINNTLYAGTFAAGIFKSEDGGENWIDISDKTIANTDEHSYAGLRDLCLSNGVLYAGTDNGVFKLIQKPKESL